MSNGLSAVPLPQQSGSTMVDGDENRSKESSDEVMDVLRTKYQCDKRKINEGLQVLQHDKIAHHSRRLAICNRRAFYSTSSAALDIMERVTKDLHENGEALLVRRNPRNPKSIVFQGFRIGANDNDKSDGDYPPCIPMALLLALDYDKIAIVDIAGVPQRQHGKDLVVHAGDTKHLKSLMDLFEASLSPNEKEKLSRDLFESSDQSGTSTVATEFDYKSWLVEMGKKGSPLTRSEMEVAFKQLLQQHSEVLQQKADLEKKCQEVEKSNVDLGKSYADLEKKCQEVEAEIAELKLEKSSRNQDDESRNATEPGPSMADLQVGKDPPVDHSRHYHHHHQQQHPQLVYSFVQFPDPSLASIPHPYHPNHSQLDGNDLFPTQSQLVSRNDGRRLGDMNSTATERGTAKQTRNPMNSSSTAQVPQESLVQNDSCASRPTEEVRVYSQDQVAEIMAISSLEEIRSFLGISSEMKWRNLCSSKDDKQERERIATVIYVNQGVLYQNESLQKAHGGIVPKIKSWKNKTKSEISDMVSELLFP